MTSLKRTLLAIPPVASANGSLKAVMMERRAAIARQRDVDFANQRQISCSTLSPPPPDLLSARLGERPARLGWPKPIGDLHIFLAFGTYNWEGVLPEALRPFGQVSAFDYAALGYDPGAPDWLSRRDEMNAQMLAAFERANAARPVDVVAAYLSGLTVDPGILRSMAQRGAVVVNFCFDDKVAFLGRLVGGRFNSTAAIASSVDLNLTSDPMGAAKYAASGGLSFFHPEAADPGVHRPHDTPFEYDVSFVGARYGWRPQFIAGLRRRGVSVTCFGRGWPNGSVATNEMPLIYSASRINLGFGGIGHSRKLVNLKGRDFEVPMSGGLYLTQHNPELEAVYDVGREILVYRDESDCAETIRALLADPAMAHDIRTRGLARARRDHTYAARWTGVFRVLGALGANEPQEIRP
jgi:spore maturation protein CgeB